MDNEKQVVQIGWSSVQAFALAVVCLAAGFGLGYLIHGPSQTTSAASTKQRGAEPSSAQSAPEMPSAEQMKHMGDKMADPLMAELKANPNDPALLGKIASVYFRAGQFSAALEYYEKAAKVEPSAERYVSLSNAYHYAGLDNQAFASLDKALELDPKSANALFNLGMLNWQVKKNSEAAIDAWQRLLKANPKHPRRAQVESLIARVKKNPEPTSNAEAVPTP
jgi:cytochrome c-type biogenesis protein CcmH/NrfG